VSTTYYNYRSAELPWSSGEEEEELYRKIRKRALLVFLVFALILPFLPVPQLARERVEELPPRLAKLLLERQTPPPPPVVKAPEPVSRKPEAKKPEVKKVETPKKPSVEAARAKAERSGLLAFKDELADLRSATPSSKLDKPQLAQGPVPAPGRSGSGTVRSLITSSAKGGSGGINTGRLSRDTGGGGLGSHSTGQVASPVGGGGGNSRVTRGGSGKAGRPEEEIKLVMDRNRGAIYTIYNRVLREDPSLQGKVVFELTILPSGQVSQCRILSSELKSPDLERKLIARIKQFNFGAKDVDTITVKTWVDFLPS
jgi:outer membrane biosynthesis protein TonB